MYSMYYVGIVNTHVYCTIHVLHGGEGAVPACYLCPPRLLSKTQPLLAPRSKCMWPPRLHALHVISARPRRQATGSRAVVSRSFHDASRVAFVRTKSWRGSQGQGRSGVCVLCSLPWPPSLIHCTPLKQEQQPRCKRYKFCLVLRFCRFALSISLFSLSSFCVPYEKNTKT